jgi:hypothetical protein
MKMDIRPPDATRRGIEDNKTRVRSHPLKNATTNPPMNVDNSCRNFPTCTGKQTLISTGSHLHAQDE